MNRKLLSGIKRWLKQPGNSRALLATKLGYESSAAIAMWMKRERVPKYQWERLKGVISL